MFNVGAARNSVQQHKEKFENLAEDLQLIKACDDAGCKRNVSLGQLFATIRDVQLEGFCCSNSCREYSHPRHDHRSEPEGAIRGSTKIGPVLEVKVTTHFVRCVIEIKISSVSKNGTQSWIVISRSVSKKVTELLEEHKKPIHFQEASSSTGNSSRRNRKNKGYRLHLRQPPFRSIHGHGTTYPL